MAMLLIEHNSPFVEPVIANGVNKQINYHIKTSPFIYKLGITKDSSIDFTKGSLKADLFFDTPEPKPVQSQKDKAFEYNVYPASDGKSCVVQLRIHILSTQNQGMLFKIRVRLSAGSQFLDYWTPSIKVVAKLDSIRKKQAEREGTVQQTRSKKRPRSDDLLDTLQSIQDQQKHHAELLQTLLFRVSSSPSPHVPETPSPFPSCSHLPTSPSHTTPPHTSHSCPTSPSSPSPPQSPQSTTPLSLETAFLQLLEAYQHLEEDERPKKLARLVQDVPSEHKKFVDELGCVLSPFTDSSRLPALPEEPMQEVQHSPSSHDLNSPQDDLHSALSSEDTFFDGDQFGYQPQSDLTAWNNAIHDFLLKDTDTA